MDKEGTGQLDDLRAKVESVGILFFRQAQLLQGCQVAVGAALGHFDESGKLGQADAVIGFGCQNIEDTDCFPDCGGKGRGAGGPRLMIEGGGLIFVFHRVNICIEVWCWVCRLMQKRFIERLTMQISIFGTVFHILAHKKKMSIGINRNLEMLIFLQLYAGVLR
jgi:hypothetical protein